MKKIFIIQMAAILAVLALTSCQASKPQTVREIETNTVKEDMGKVSAAVKLGEIFTIEKAEGQTLRQFPFAFGIKEKAGSSNAKVYVAFSEHLDSGQAEAKPGAKITYDGGVTFPDYKEGVSGTSVIQRKDGSLLSMVFRTSHSPEDSKVFYTEYLISTDYGNTWNKYTGKAIFSEPAKSLYFHRGIIQTKDGNALLAPTYGGLEKDTKNRTMLAKSTDGGATWNIVSTIATVDSTNISAISKHSKFGGVTEASIERCADGSILTVMRIGGGAPLFQSRSADEGLTWSEPVKLPGQPDLVIEGVNPHLVRISNGILVLGYGRPGMKILLSLDGNGEKWTNLTNVYNGPITSGYPSLVEVSPNKLLLVGDTGANWQYKLNPFPTPNPFSIWGRFIEIEK